MLKSLRAKVTLLVLLLGIPFLVASVQGLLFASEQSNLQERKSLAKRALNRMARDLQGDNPRGRIQALYEQSGLDSLGVGVALVDRQGNALWESPHRSPVGERRGVQQQVLDQGILLFAMPERQTSPELQRVVYLGASGVLVLYGIGAWLLVGWTLRPISKLAAEVREASSHPELVVPAPSTDREIETLVSTLNDLIQKVRSESAERVDSYATLSHELRTPIHALLLELDGALAQQRTPEELESSLVDVQRKVLRLKQVSEAVLTLHGVTRNGGGLLQEPLDLGALLRSEIESVAPLCELRSIRFVADVAADLTVVQSKDHLELLLRNLVENAAKHARTGCEVLVSTARKEGQVELVIANDVDEENLLHGSRLGLRICREIARANGWGFQADSAEGRFVVQVLFSNSER